MLTTWAECGIFHLFETYNESFLFFLLKKERQEITVNNFQREETLRTKETFGVSLFIPALTRYLSTAVTHLSPPSLSLSPAAFSHTQALQHREKDLGDHLKPIMAALQPPRNSVTDGDLVFIAGVIGSACTHARPCAYTYTHTKGNTKAKDLNVSVWMYTHKSQFVFILKSRRCSYGGAHNAAGLTGCGGGAPLCTATRLMSYSQSKWRSHSVNQKKPLSWEDK